MKINFISNRPWLNNESPSKPRPSIKQLPDWYINADRYVKNKYNEYVYQNNKKVPSWKACPSIYDIMGSGYFLRTPCDIEFYEKNGKLEFNIHKRYQDFIHHRSPLHGFNVPYGYKEEHFAWWPDWSISVPEGYSILYSQPFNRFELPFLNTSGIIDNDKVNVPGSIPFFIRDGWSGIIKSGTPYVQLFPFKRDDWESNYEFLEEDEIYRRNTENSIKYRTGEDAIYLNHVWSRRKYE